jgi:protocatechuate 3,4-dioxygenase beta subunit
MLIRTARNKRDRPSADKWAAGDHEADHGHSGDPQDLFDFSWYDDPKYNNTGCALGGLSTYGPFCHEGKPERRDIRAGWCDIYLCLAIQIIDINRCRLLASAQVNV